MKKKWKDGFFTVVVYSGILWTALSAGYLTLSPELQEMLPFMNVGTAIVGGTMTALTSSAGLAVKRYLTKNKQYTNEVNKETVDKFFLIIDEYKEIKEGYQNILNESKTNNKLIAALLNSKLDNPMLTDTARELIEGALNVKEE